MTSDPNQTAEEAAVDTTHDAQARITKSGLKKTLKSMLVSAGIVASAGGLLYLGTQVASGGNENISHGVADSVLRKLVLRHNQDEPVYASDFGEKCDGSSDNRAAYTAAAKVAVARGRSLELGAGTCLVTSGTVIVTGPLYDIHGKGQSVTNVQERFNGPLFQLNVTGAAGTQNFRYHDMTMSAYFSPAPGTYPSATTAIDVTGDSLGYFQHGGFDHLRLQGFYAGMTFEKPTVTTSFGKEARTAWLSFANITCEVSTQDGQWCLWFKQGSGTGNTYNDMRTTIAGAGTGATAPSSMLRFEGPATAVVGDIIVYGAHVGAVHSVVSVGAGTNYRNNISVCGSQFDAGTSNIFDLPADDPPFVRLNAACGNNVGSGVSLKLPPVGGSLVDDQLTDERRSGTNSMALANSSSLVSVPLFSVSTGSTTNSNFYGGTVCDVQVDGFIAGLNAGATKASYLLPYAPSGFLTPVLDRQVQSQVSASFFTIKAAASAGTVTFSTAYTAARGGIINDAQIVCRGGTYTVKRLL